MADDQQLPFASSASGRTWTPLAADPVLPAAESQEGDADSSLGPDDTLSSTASLESSVLQYREEHGRTYHGYKPSIAYVLPNDGPEQDRLNLQHHLFLLTFDGQLTLSPAGSTKGLRRVLDAGTGTGIWATDFGDGHPETEIIGIDLSPIQPSFVPPNVQFQIDDLEDEWAFSYKFDLVFGRMLVGAVADWPKFIKQSYDHLEPGGWLELQDICFPLGCDDGTVADDEPISKWCSYMLEATRRVARPADGPKLYRQRFIDAGFVHVEERIYKWPSNTWPKDPKYKELGAWCCENIVGGLSGLSLALFTRGLGWNLTEVEVFLAGVRKSMRNTNVHAWWPIYVVYGQKPD
ncbi:S-adenosyl-L-methionine-dependent methyltransferase [Sodiomyces alkalinus F11]|uniref:S-adenosyl-L-methionine-dependent methyltransferase n=1 Tax=Sodiomyces alkalinus (strain CBS 110278 / VKM F-3762 / F11) TaxID=1314773 RepID=A0A3N2PID1_SODAK|nr:S-adenosyl-L-methionine-dependent methyltransferase [Sodiomyces alkalinus F11]ROT34441.1 S-adenosyl-L-methionine-dependent methyltransferase [Sodiomyces alkalinus F11]